VARASPPGLSSTLRCGISLTRIEVENSAQPVTFIILFRTAARC
jgi:hypothetical protein